MKYGDAVSTRIPVLKHNGDEMMDGLFWEVRDRWFNRFLGEMTCKICQPEYQVGGEREKLHTVTIVERLLVKL